MLLCDLLIFLKRVSLSRFLRKDGEIAQLVRAHDS